MTLVGVPGIGKSRMVWELLQTVEADPELVTWRQGRCLPYGEGVALWALGEIVKAQAGILESDPPSRRSPSSPGRRRSAVPLLLVATARPELLARRPGWGGGKPNSTIVSLAPLAEADIARLVGQLLGQVLLPAELQAALLARAGGNPLYAEEYVRMLADRGYLERVGGSWRLERAARAGRQRCRPDRLVAGRDRHCRWRLPASRRPLLPDRVAARRGVRPASAAEQLLGGGRDADAKVQLQRALAFYRQVDAAGYLREADALVASSA